MAKISINKYIFITLSLMSIIKQVALNDSSLMLPIILQNMYITTVYKDKLSMKKLQQ